MIHVTLCLLSVVLAWSPFGRSFLPEHQKAVRAVALLYGSVQGFFFFTRAPAAHYGESWWLLVAAVETITALSMAGINHWSARWVARVSWSAAAINLACIPLSSPVYAAYPGLVICSEIARASCIIVASGPIWGLLLRWHKRRESRKESTWLAKLALIPR